MSNDTSLDWNALLQKTEEKITKLENFYDSQDPLTEIDKVRGVEHAYYDEQKEMQEAEEMISRMEEEGSGTEDRRHTSPVQGARDAPIDIPEEHMSPRARRLYQQFSREKKENYEEEAKRLEEEIAGLGGLLE